jgi:hypothetical protein
MFNPLVENPANLSTDELEKKVIELTKKYTTATRFPNQSVLTQISSVLTMYREELVKRQRQELQNATNKDNDNDLGSLINVE